MIVIENRVPNVSELSLARFVVRARKAIGLNGTVDALLTSSAKMKSLNRRFRGKNAATDVLSFPAELSNGGKRRFAGEVAISTDIAVQNAQTFGHTPAEELKILLLHGLLHLRGYDHERDNGRMARLETKLRAQLGLPVGLIERTEFRLVKRGKIPAVHGRVTGSLRKSSP